MDKPPLALDPNFSGASEDFPAILRRKSLLQSVPEPTAAAGNRTFIPTESTTILAFKFAGGVTQLQEMSVDGKVRALSKLLRDNFGFVMQGVGVVVPIFATYDGNSKPKARLYFYDAMGAQFEVTDYAATGSGSPAVRGILYYENNWGDKKLRELNEEEAVAIALRALDTAAEADTSTGGVDRGGKIFPLIKIVSREGITTLPEEKIAGVFNQKVA